MVKMQRCEIYHCRQATDNGGVRQRRQRNLGARDAEAASRRNSGSIRGAMSSDRTITLVERTTEPDLLICNSVACKSSCEDAATLQTTSAWPLMTYASSTCCSESTSAATSSRAPWAIANVTNRCTA